MFRMDHLLVMLILLCLCPFNSCENVTHNKTTCSDVARESLLVFKRGLVDPSGFLSSWKGKDCCHWIGVECSNNIVTMLDLHDSRLRGKINFTSLHALEFLDYLDLSSNYFDDASIDASIGGLRNLRYLDLSLTYLSGEISPHLGNLSKLEYLNLNYTQLDQTREGWLDAVNKLSSLVELHLSNCGLSVLPYSLPLINFTSLVVLDLSRNHFNSSVPSWLFNLTSLVELRLSDNPFAGFLTEWDFSNFKALQVLYIYSVSVGGQLPRSLGSLCKLNFLNVAANNLNGTMDEFLQGFSSCPNGNSLLKLYLHVNKLEGEIPTSIGILKHLQVLELNNNNFSGQIPQIAIGKLEELTDLSLGEHNYEGFITELLFMNLKSLKNFNFVSDKVVFNVSLDWMPPFRLTYLRIKNSQVGPRFPKWILVQSKLTQVTLSISDVFPVEWFTQISQEISIFDLSKNQIRGKLPGMHFKELDHLDLSENQIRGKLPSMHFQKSANIDLSYNLFEGSLPLWSTNATSLSLSLSHNNISGRIPSWIYTFAFALQLSNNQLSGPLLECSHVWSNISFIDISNNHLTGTIPRSIFLSSRLKMVLLSNNRLEGALPSSLQNSSLGSLDVGGNMLSGSLPTWVPASWVLRLRSNFFHGAIPEQWCNNPLLHILDLADNNLLGPIPHCFSNLTVLADGQTSKFSEEHLFIQEINIVSKGRVLKYTSTTKFVNIIDLSDNDFTDIIPEGLMKLYVLGTLNLSMNHLIGGIPESIGDLRLLESLDFSHNNLSRQIPQSLSSITFLSHLNLSNNNLEGRIPSGTQLQTLNDSSIYEGNPLLCGLPLPNKCDADGEFSGVNESDDDEEEMLWFFISMVAGYVFGLGGVCFILWVSSSFRRTYFGFFRLY